MKFHPLNKSQDELDYERELENSNNHFDYLEPIANRITNLDEQIKFWYDEIEKWNRRVPYETLLVSGYMLKKTGLNGYLFFEKFANDRINKLKEVKKLEPFEQQPANNLKNALLNANYQKPNKAKAIENLKNEFEKLRLHISGFNQNNNLDYLLNQLKYRFDEIEHQQINIEKEHKRLRNQDLNSWTNSEIEMNQIEIDYFHEILNLCDDAKANIIENLAIHNFTFFDGEKKKFLEYLEPDHHLRRKRKEAKPALPAENKTEYDENFWCMKCFGLFNYLSDNYNATAKIQKFINIWFYLEYETPPDYVFNFAKDNYKPYIFERFSIEIKKMNKPTNYDNQLIILNNHYSNYCNKLKEVK